VARLAINIEGIEAFESEELRSCIKQIKGKIQLLTASMRQHIRVVVPNDLNGHAGSSEGPALILAQ